MKRFINLTPSRGSRWLLGLIPFAIIAMVYLGLSNARLAENPNDRLLPSPATMAETFRQLATEASVRTGTIPLWDDTFASLERLGVGIAISALIGLVVGLLNGGLPLIRAKLSPLVTVVSLIPPMAILPVLFIAFGTGEMAKIALIVIGVTPFLIRDLQNHALRLPDEQLIKAQTLGASSWQVLLRVLLPQLTPRLIASTRLALGSAWLFLIAAEAIAAQEGLGYRIFLVRRYLAMDVILPYVAWITFLAFLIDRILALTSQRAFPWYHAEEGDQK
ncbi:ABC transporter permease subunit [Halomonas sp. McH1-25]|uniref:ABC transporter permease n=1 Tax=unclassified Halomonas TaxID=2609666 RepID=UPI001EF57D65|nr:MULTISPECIES: ABC transporter permease subunit [unclassified Halomonas]MCG7599228.1 ABC transporter permease subunit [Halomonas sp. McH1-25]MCP1341096.1 ABC transporter permease subunit [Halomonas sp. FL8]MCP1361684.1 ABC transporter permease subunit [Halomonas sp. BBD45]MCP1365351.1 ABC transporter permease subunit [Halomonas sp. BBD48]